MSEIPTPYYEPSRSAMQTWAMSIVFHVVLLLVLGWTVGNAVQGNSREQDRPVGVALVERLPDRDRYSEPPAPPEVSAENVRATEAASNVTAASAAPPAMAPPVDLDGILKEMTAGDVPAVSSGNTNGAFGAGTDTQGDGTRPKLDGKPTTAMVFGVTGSGSRFIYVFDRSDSMNGFGGRPLRAAKKELIRSLESLSDDQQFQIVFYNDDAKPFVPAGSPLSLLRGEQSMIQRATRYVDSIKAFGGTEHFTALKLALRLGPDVIFFLSDARTPRLSAGELADVRRWADRSGASIHAIEFGVESETPTDSFLQQLATENRGQYRYLSIADLDSRVTNDVSGESVAP